MKIFCAVNKSKLLISNMHCQELYLGNFKIHFDCFAPSDSRFSNSCILAKYCPNLTDRTPMERFFIQLSDVNFEKLYNSYLLPGEDLKNTKNI